MSKDHFLSLGKTFSSSSALLLKHRWRGVEESVACVSPRHFDSDRSEAEAAAIHSDSSLTSLGLRKKEKRHNATTKPFGEIPRRRRRRRECFLSEALPNGEEIEKTSCRLIFGVIFFLVLYWFESWLWIEERKDKIPSCRRSTKLCMKRNA